MSFKKISKEEYNKFHLRLMVDKHEKLLLKSEFVSTSDKEFMFNFNMGILNECKLVITSTSTGNWGSKIEHIHFCKKMDEWFYLSYDYYIIQPGPTKQAEKNYYRCDQIYGLIDFINEKVLV